MQKKPQCALKLIQTLENELAKLNITSIDINNTFFEEKALCKNELASKQQSTPHPEKKAKMITCDDSDISRTAITLFTQPASPQMQPLHSHKGSGVDPSQTNANAEESTDTGPKY